MLRPWLGVASCVFCIFAIIFEVLVFVFYFTFLGLEFFGLIAAIFGIMHGFCGMMTSKADCSFQTRQTIFLVDFTVSVLFAFMSFGMLCGTAAAFSIYLFVAAMVGTTPYVLELMALFGIPVVPFLTLIALKGFATVVYIILFSVAVAAAVSNRRNRPHFIAVA
ncbi:hypothetical protein BV898_08250 [Hypsibius exemplaris]|uniref:Uncharacterized protein n=1 Tax=Hypsibius exemplaris TaxID=2072580 RepID=A0A1W0WQZ7_HYPEX|nr:hypothetical protein BV898_08250 [Hypsibius exemplaris]